MKRNPIPYILIAWFASGLIRVLLGSDTSPIAYFFFGIFWLVSGALLIAAIRQLILSKHREEKIEALSIGAVLISVFIQGLLGNGDAIAVAVLVFFVATFLLMYIYAKRLRRNHLARL